MPELEFREAIHQALDEELERDETVVFFGEDVAVAGGVFATTKGLFERHGPDRVFRHAHLRACAAAGRPLAQQYADFAL